MINTAFFPHSCHRCGQTDEARFAYAGPHVKQVCNACGAYVKFFPIGAIPDVLTIRGKIWYVSGQSRELIERAKVAAEYADQPDKLQAQMAWWRVWLEVRKIIAANNINST